MADRTEYKSCPQCANTDRWHTDLQICAHCGYGTEAFGQLIEARAEVERSDATVAAMHENLDIMHGKLVAAEARAKTMQDVVNAAQDRVAAIDAKDIDAMIEAQTREDAAVRAYEQKEQTDD